MQEPQTIAMSLELFKATFGYLNTRPRQEVNQLCQAMEVAYAVACQPQSTEQALPELEIKAEEPTTTEKPKRKAGV